MNARCQELRGQIPAVSGEGARLPDPLREHLAECRGCVAWLARRSPTQAALLCLPRRNAPAALEARVVDGFESGVREGRAQEALRDLPRLAAPAELEGRVVAACHAGHREDRASAFLRDGLRPMQAPAELEWRVAAAFSDHGTGSNDGTGAGAPAELDERLARDLGDLPGTLSERYAGRLERQPAPESLRERVSESLERMGRRRSRAAGAAVWVGAAGLLIAGLLGFAGWQSAQEASSTGALRLVRLDAPEVDFDVYLAEPRALDLSPVARALAGGVTGGLSDVLAAGSTRPLPRSVSSTRRPAGRSVPGAPPLGDDDSTAKSGASAPASPGETSNFMGPGAGAPANFADRYTQPFLEKLEQAPFQVLYSGQRRIVIRDPETDTSLELLEGVWSDGQGRFAVRLLSSGPSELFELMHRGREGFIQRYRDFRVRDLARFLAAFEVDVLDERAKIAGRHAVVMELARRDEPSSRYRVAVDPETGLVLSYEERVGPNQELVASLVFESLDLEPDLDSIELTGGPSRWSEFDPHDPPSEIAPNLRLPGYAPRHHGLESAGTLKGALGRMWARFVFGDGVDQVFFLHTLADAGGPSISGATGLARGDSVRVCRVGAWTIVSGEIQSVQVVALGKIDVDEILLTVQSAFVD